MDATEEQSIGKSMLAAVEKLRAVRRIGTPEEERAWIWRNVVRPHLIAAGFGVEYREHRALSKAQQKVHDRVEELLKPRRGAIVALIGPRGTGKTTITAQLAWSRAWNEQLPPWERRPPYRKLGSLIATYKPLYADFGSIDIERLTERRDQFCDLHPLVIIDELHECDEQRMKNRVLTDIIDRRYAQRNDTILISNETSAEFHKSTPDSVISRLEHHGKIIECNWPSFRRSA